jgi:hypothetical protein
MGGNRHVRGSDPNGDVPGGGCAVVGADRAPALDYRSTRGRGHTGFPSTAAREPIDRLHPALEVVAVAVASATDAGRAGGGRVRGLNTERC